MFRTCGGPTPVVHDESLMGIRKRSVEWDSESIWPAFEMTDFLMFEIHDDPLE